MTDRLTEFSGLQKKLPNGLNIIVKPMHNIPRVEAQMWYNVGSKHEDAHEKGMAHLIEHMLFKGTEKLSESDINLITHKLTGYTNAFTSHDVTSFVFRVPSNSWQHTLDLFADCMQNARFDAQMLWSEVKAVIEELRMYRDDYQNTLIQALISAIFPEHPYHYPIIGSKHDLARLDRDALFTFYKKHYHPANATLVIVGDVDVDEVFAYAEKLFSTIASPAETKPQAPLYFDNDTIAKTVTVYRQITTPFCCFVYAVPGLKDQKNHLLDMASLILGHGRSSRLYKRLVEQEQLAADVECFTLDFFEKGIFGISVYPLQESQISIIEEVVEQELEKLRTEFIEEWEFHAAQKKVALDFASLLESGEKQAIVLGNFALATNDPQSIEQYFFNVKNVTKQELQDFFVTYFAPFHQHKGYLRPLSEQGLAAFQELQQQSDELEQLILARHQRTSPVEPGRVVNTIPAPALQKFHYPQPQEFALDNGLSVVYHNNSQVPYVACVLNFKANPYYDPDTLQGLFTFLLQLMTDRTAQLASEEFHTMLETKGIHLQATSESIAIKCLSEDIGQALHVLGEILTTPSFDEKTIEKIKQQILNEITEYWDTPVDFIDQIAKQKIYQGHPYHKNSMGTLESVQAITAADLKKCYDQYISPQGALLTLVGDFGNYDLPQIITERLGSWNGIPIAPLSYPPLVPAAADIITHQIKRDQVVLAFVTPTISRIDSEFLKYALLDIVLTGGSSGTMSSRLYALREQSGLFYAIGGSLLHGAREERGMMHIKTIVSADKVEEAQKLIMQTIQEIGQHGITEDEFTMAKNLLLSSLVEYFETNSHMAYTFSFLKKYNLSFNLFDKQLEALSIIKIEDINRIAKQVCNSQLISIIRVGRIKNA